MAVTIVCPKLSCRAILSVPEGTRGQRVRCSSCGTAFLVPQQTPQKGPRRESPETAKSQDHKD